MLAHAALVEQHVGPERLTVEDLFSLSYESEELLHWPLDDPAEPNNIIAVHASVLTELAMAITATELERRTLAA